MKRQNSAEKNSSKPQRAGRSRFPTPAKKKIVKEVNTETEELERRQREAVMHQEGSL